MKLTVNTDGGSRGNPGVSGGGIIVLDGQQELYSAAVPFGTKTNNEAEYLAVFHALQFLQKFLKTSKEYSSETVRAIEFVLDSKLVVEQLSRRWKIKEPRLRQLAQDCWELIATLPSPVSFRHVLRHHNARADLLANQAMDESA